MYKYYNNLNNYHVVLEDIYSLDKTVYANDYDLYMKYYFIFEDIKFLNKLIISFNYDLFYEWYKKELNINDPYEMWQTMGEFESLIHNEDGIILPYEEKITTDISLEKVFHDINSFYMPVITCVMHLYPNYKEKIKIIKKHFEDFLDDACKKIFTIKSNRNIDYIFPDAFFITPNGYLYNSGGKLGHKNNNFINLYIKIINTLMINKKLPVFYYSYFNNKLELIKELGYIDHSTYISWMNLFYSLPDIWVPDKENIKQRIDFIIDNNLNNITFWPSERRSYQPNLIRLYEGYCDAYIEFYKFFNNHFKSSPKKDYEDIKNITNNQYIYDEIVELLVRCMGFHKIESQLSKVITTTSLTPVNDFYNYLINGYDIYIIPKIIYENGFKEVYPYDIMPAYSFRAIEKYELNNSDKGKIHILTK